MINTIWLMLWLIAINICCFILLGLHLLRKHYQESKFNNRKELYKERTESSWRDYFLNDGPLPVSSIPLRKEEIEGYEELSYIYVYSVTSESTSQKLHLIAKKYLGNHYEKLLNSKRKGPRLKALARIEDYGNIEILKEGNGADKKTKTKEELLLLLSIYSKYDETTFRELFLKYESSITEYECRKMFNHLSKHALTSLISQFPGLESHSRYALIDTLSIKREFEYIPFLKGLVNDNDREVRIRGAKALYTMGIGDEEVCFKLADSQSWEEKFMAAKLAQYTNFNRVKDILFQLLEDREWKVREQAARTIARHRDAGFWVEKYIESSSDQYAVGILREIMEREGSGSWTG
ncbi:hypothetical protein [Ureibacillus aquaedulcis]|uniref:HEAT repeat domain-containing protein n=1 Tax=Ureibacillus aquaedulcis TaxID=3058421 RepID=A0ABT8GMQ5_9BACL|nr:hypothetical protein [Ureibacillus sp. BA0131]MDN4492692.1 hypothetical protein [Ureibacillus sp. BA0131]